MKQAILVIVFGLFMSLHLDINIYLPEILFIFHLLSFAFICTTVVSVKQTHIRINIPCVIVFCIITYLVLFYLLKGNLYGSYRYYALTIIWSLYYPFSIAFAQNKKYIKNIVGIIILTLVLEIVWGVLQSVGLVSNSSKFFTIGGSFGSVGAFSGYLGVIAPLILSLALTYRRKANQSTIYYFLLAVLLFTFYLIFMTQSRGGLLASLGGCLIVLIYRYPKILSFFTRSSKVKKISLFSIFIFVVASGYALYKVKENSAFGRLFIWKVTTQTPHENLVIGNGIDYFKTQYGKWQSVYFEESTGLEKEKYVADYVTTAYNEFLEIGLEQGAIVIILIAILFFITIIKGWKNLTSIELGVKASLLSILILMLCSYPFRILPIVLYFIFCLSVIGYRQKELFNIKNYRNVGLVFRLGLLMLTGIVTYKALDNAYGLYLLRKGQILTVNNDPISAIKVYNKASMSLKNNGELSFYIGSTYAKLEESKKAIEALERACKLSSDPNNFILLGNTYERVENYLNAEKEYKLVANMQPNRLYPKYLLAKLYYNSERYNDAIWWGLEILKTEEKVPTVAGKEIREEIELLINAIKKKGG